MVAPSVLWLTAFQLQASKALYVLYTTTEDAGCFSTICVFHLGALIGHKHSQERLSYKQQFLVYLPGSSLMFICSWMFCPIEHAQCWATFPLISWVVQLNAFASLHSLCQYLNLFSFPTLLHSQYFCQCCFFSSFFFTFVLQSFSLAHKKFSLCCCYCTVQYISYLLYILGSSH